MTGTDDHASVGKDLNLIQTEFLAVLPDCVDVCIGC
jgi:hypothetical protein